MTTSRREALILGAAGLAAAAAGFMLGPLMTGGNESESALKAARFPDLAGKPRAMAEWRGRVLLINFWATWCAPCREEIPLLMQAATKYRNSGLEIVGIAVDNSIKVGEYARKMDISYPILLAEAEGLEFMRKLGNSAGGLPYTVIVDRQGAVAERKLGAYKGLELEHALASFLRS